MRTIFLVLFGLICTSALARADEQFSTLKVGSAVYSNVTVTSVSGKDIYFSHASGMGSAKLKDLDPALQSHFHYDAMKAKPTEKGGPAGNPPDLSNPKAALDDAMARVRFIINQPVTAMTATRDMDVSIYSPGWFHPGAIRPDFNTVDIRATQDLSYSKNHYVTSDLNPGTCFLGSEVEFNSMTKYFYTDRSVPKKKLTEAEMLEINRLYRIIGTCEQTLSEGPAARLLPQSIPRFLTTHLTAVATGVAGLIFVVMVVLNFRKGRAEA